MITIKILWLGPFPLSILHPLPVKHKEFHSEHPAPWIVNLSRAFAANHTEIDIHIVNSSGLVRKSFSTSRGSVTIHIVKSSFNLILGKNWTPSFKLNVFTRYYWPRYLLNRVIKEIEPDIIHTFGTETAYSLAAMDSGLPYIVYLQGIIQEISKFDPSRNISSTRVDLERKVFDNCRYYISETAYGEEFILNNVPEAIVWRVANSVSSPFFDVNHNGEVNHKLIFVGAIIPGKGIRELLSVVEKNEYSLTIVGNNTRKFARKLMQRYSSNSRIVWTGHVTSSGISALMTTHDALVLPSYIDTSPNVVAEAMATGLPVIGTHVGGIPDMIEDGETGILVEPRSIESLEKAIKQLYSDSDNMLQMGLNGRKKAMKMYKPACNAQIISKAYAQILKTRESKL